MSDEISSNAVTTVYEEIQQEREYQRQKWGGASHDDQHGAWDWIALLTEHSGKAVRYGSVDHLDPEAFRRQLICVAALAVAAIEWVDRHWTD